MPSLVHCEKGHKGGTCREAAICLAKTGTLGVCAQPGCQSIMKYSVNQSYPGKGDAKFELVRVIRLYNDREAEEEGYDPMVLILKKHDSIKHVIWLFYWAKNRHGAWHVGQFPPLLSVNEFHSLSNKIDRMGIS